MTRINLSLILMICGTFIACQTHTLEIEATEKTYPDASDFPLTTLDKILNHRVSGKYNVRVYIIKITHCEPHPNVRCPITGLYLSQQLTSTTKKTIILPAQEKQQFKEGRRYIMSLNIDYYTHAVTNDLVPKLELLGYDFSPV